MNRILRIGRETESALDSGRPVVAVETSFFLQRMLWPMNYETALACMEDIHSSGAVPSPVVIAGGRAIVG